MKCRKIQKGSCFGIICPSSRCTSPKIVERFLNYLNSLGFKYKVGKTVTASFGYLAGTDELKAEDFNDTSINNKTFEARTASINIFRTMEILVDFVAIVVEVLLIVGYFITLNTWYSVMIVCAIVPSVIRQVKKLTQQRTVQELLLKKKQNIQMLEKKNIDT